MLRKGIGDHGKSTFNIDAAHETEVSEEVTPDLAMPDITYAYQCVPIYLISKRAKHDI